MGCVSSDAEQPEIDNFSHFLILGPSYSGKTTFLSQVRHLYNLNKYTREVLTSQVQTIALENIQSLFDLVKDYDICFPDSLDDELVQGIEQLPLLKHISPDQARQIQLLCQLPSFLDIFPRLSFHMPLADLGYIIDALPRLVLSKYTPTDLDLLRLQYPTAGLQDVRLELPVGSDKQRICFVDTCGESHVRTKALALGSLDTAADSSLTASSSSGSSSKSGNAAKSGSGGSGSSRAGVAGVPLVTRPPLKALIFVAALDVFTVRDAVSGRSALLEAMALFKQICTEKKCALLPRFLVLNKVDSFEALFPARSAAFKELFPDFKGEIVEPKAAVDFVRRKFIDICPEVELHTIVCSLICTDAANTFIRHSFEKFCKHVL